MKNRFVNFCLLFFASFPLHAQFTVNGRISDNANRPLEFVSVLLFKAGDTVNLFKGTVTDSTGTFRFRELPGGAYRLTVQYIGFLRQQRSIVLQTSSSVELGVILLQPDSTVLGTVEVTGRRAVVQKTTKGFVMNANALLTQQGGTAIDLLRSTPTVFVDAEGGITLRGKSPLILINGRNSAVSNLATITASSIEKIEIITNPSAEYDAEAENGIINIVLKKGKEEGVNGAFALGAGYGSRGRLNSSALLNYRKKHWNLGVAYDNRFAGRTRQATGNRINFNLPEQYFLDQQRQDKRLEETHNLRLNFDYDYQKYALTTEFIHTIENETNRETLFSTFEKQNLDFNSRNRRFSEEIRKGSVYEVASTLQRKFTQKDKKLVFAVSGSFNRSTENTSIYTQYLTADNQATGPEAVQKTLFGERSMISNLRLDYSVRWGKGILETGFKSLFRNFDNDFGQEDQVNGSFQPVPSRTGTFRFSEGVHAGYGQYKIRFENWDIETGIRGEQTINNGTLKTQNTAFSNSYFNLFPGINIGRKLSDQSSLRLLYGKRINRPGLGQLNPFTDITDSLTQRSGNPALKPEIVDNLELSFGTESKQQNLTLKTYYRRGRNTILPFTELQSNGVLFTRLLNVGTTQTLGLEGIYSYVPFEAWQGNLSASLFRQVIDAGNIQAEVVNRVVSWNLKWLNDFSVWKNGKLQVIGVYNSPTATIQGTRIAVYNVDLAFQQKVLKSNGRIGIIVTDIFNTQKSGFNWNTPDFSFSRTFKIDTRAILVTFAYTFKSSFRESLMKNQFLND